MANLIPQIARMLGVEIGEEFQIKEYGERIYRFANSGLQLIYDNGVRNLNTTTNMALSGLLSGDFEIVKMPWKPKFGEKYYSFGGKFIGDSSIWIIVDVIWDGLAYDVDMLDKGWVFHTKEEAKAALPAVAAELGVEYEL